MCNCRGKFKINKNTILYMMMTTQNITKENKIKVYHIVF